MAEKIPVCTQDGIHEDVLKSVGEKMQDENQYRSLAELYKIFGDATRIKLLHALHIHEMCVCDLAVLLGVTKSAVSHQLKSLKMANLVQYRREGQVVYYSLADSHVEKIIDMGMEHINE